MHNLNPSDESNAFETAIHRQHFSSWALIACNRINPALMLKTPFSFLNDRLNASDFSRRSCTVDYRELR